MPTCDPSGDFAKPQHPRDGEAMIALISYEHVTAAADQQDRQRVRFPVAIGETEPVAPHFLEQRIKPPCVILRQITKRPAPAYMAVPCQASAIGIGEQVCFQPIPAFNEALGYRPALGCFGELMAAGYVPVAIKYPV